MASVYKNLCLARHGANYIAHFKQAMATSHHIGAVRMFSSTRPLPHLQLKSQSSSAARLFGPKAFHNIALQTGEDEPALVSKAAPAHYLVQIDSFSRLEKQDKFETGVFETAGYKWKLKFYNDVDNTESVPVKLALSDTSAFPENWEVDAVFSISLKNQISGSYFSVLGRAHFDATKTELGGFLPKHFLTDPSYGYLKDDMCVFGAEVFVNRNDVVTENMSLENVKPPPCKQEFKIPNFPSPKEGGGWVTHQTWTSEVFSAGGHNWMVKVSPERWGKGTGRLSICVENIVDSVNDDDKKDSDETSDQEYEYDDSDDASGKDSDDTDDDDASGKDSDDTDDDDSVSSNKDPVSSDKDSDSLSSGKDPVSSDKDSDDDSDGSDDDSLGIIKASYTMTLKSQTGADYVKSMDGRFSASEGDGIGWHSFIDLPSLHDPDKDFISNGCIHLQLELSVEEGLHPFCTCSQCGRRG